MFQPELVDKNKALDLKSWSSFLKKYIESLFENEGVEEYFKLLIKGQAQFYPNRDQAIKFYQTLKGDPRFDHELKLFFSFIDGCGFFVDHKLEFENWIRMNYWIFPQRVSSDYYDSSIFEILSHDYGINYLKGTCDGFHFWKTLRGEEVKL